MSCKLLQIGQHPWSKNGKTISRPKSTKLLREWKTNIIFRTKRWQPSNINSSTHKKTSVTNGNNGRNSNKIQIMATTHIKMHIKIRTKTHIIQCHLRELLLPTVHLRLCPIQTTFRHRSSHMALLGIMDLKEEVLMVIHMVHQIKTRMAQTMIHMRKTHNMGCHTILITNQIKTHMDLQVEIL